VFSPRRRQPTCRMARMQAAIDALWMYTGGELFAVDATERALIDARHRGRLPRRLEPHWRQAVQVRPVTKRRSPSDRSVDAGHRASAAAKQGAHNRASCRTCWPSCSRFSRAHASARVVMQYVEDPPQARRQSTSACPASDRELAASGRASAACSSEIPVVSVVELGIVRASSAGPMVGGHGDATYSGCPATRVIEDDIRTAIAAAGGEQARVVTALAPGVDHRLDRPRGARKASCGGIAPPGAMASHDTPVGSAGRSRSPAAAAIPCPNCGSLRTRSELRASARRPARRIIAARLPGAVRLLQAATDGCACRHRRGHAPGAKLPASAL
jgi:ring-1,2-phenylacetyl-CoA epoxidase subunit PaaD